MLFHQHRILHAVMRATCALGAAGLLAVAVSMSVRADEAEAIPDPFAPSFDRLLELQGDYTALSVRTAQAGQNLDALCARNRSKDIANVQALLAGFRMLDHAARIVTDPAQKAQVQAFSGLAAILANATTLVVLNDLVYNSSIPPCNEVAIKDLDTRAAETVRDILARFARHIPDI